MATLDTYGHRRTEPANLAEITPQTAISLALVAGVTVCVVLSGTLGSLYVPVIISGYFGRIIFLRFVDKMRQVPAKEGQLSLSKKGMVFNLREGGFSTSSKEEYPLVPTHGGCGARLFVSDNSGVENRIKVTFGDGRTFERYDKDSPCVTKRSAETVGGRSAAQGGSASHRYQTTHPRQDGASF